MKQDLYDYYISEKRHHTHRHMVEWNLAQEYAEKGLTPIERMTDRFERLCHEEKAVIIDGEQIVFMRTVSNLPEIFTECEWKQLHKKYFIYGGLDLTLLRIIIAQ